ncbi:MAG TPA: hypothetical protein VNE21_03035 [Mycobacteriales bacterium]|nr:hypothetical protein [Mycobacteriales bacterium]
MVEPRDPERLVVEVANEPPRIGAHHPGERGAAEDLWVTWEG